MSGKIKLNTKAVHFVICALCAFFLWFYVSYNVSPVVTKTIKNIPVSINNEDKLNTEGYSAKLTSDNKVDVKVTAKRKDFTKINLQNARATVDVSTLVGKKGPQPLEASVQFLSANYEDVDTKKAIVTFFVQEYEEAEFDITLGEIKEPSDGYYINGEAQFNNSSTVKVSGIKDDVEKVSKVVTETINLTDAIDDITNPYQLIPVDENGKAVKDVRLSAEKVSLTFEIYKAALLPLVVEDIPESKADVKFTIEPSEVLVHGPAALIDEMTHIAVDYRSKGSIKTRNDDIFIDAGEPDTYEIKEEEE
ncbi:MAG: hypothetical protein IKU60_05340 [Clostridia bacterium]|nr:hypothetical protein [Clostridia bacterium]